MLIGSSDEDGQGSGKATLVYQASAVGRPIELVHTPELGQAREVVRYDANDAEQSIPDSNCDV